MFLAIRLSRIKRLGLLALLLALMVLLFRGMLGHAVQTLAQTETSVRLPIVMYHHVLADEERAGLYVITPQTLEKDLIYLKQQGYETVLPSELVAFSAGEGSLPERPILLSFDDGFLSHQTEVLPLLERYECKAVFSIVGRYTDRYTEEPSDAVAYANLSWAQVEQLSAHPLIELANHSDALHEQSASSIGIERFEGEGDEAYHARLLADLDSLQQKMEERTGQVPICFTYPFGIGEEGAQAVLEALGFALSLTCNEGVNHLSGQAGELYDLKRFNRESGVSSEQFFERLQ